MFHSLEALVTSLPVNIEVICRIAINWLTSQSDESIRKERDTNRCQAAPYEHPSFI
jgi:hypothetical protein